MYFRLLIESFLKDRREKLLAVAVIFLSAALITALLNISIDVGDRMTAEMKSFGANLVVAPKGDDLSLEIGGIDYNPLKGKTWLKESDLAEIKNIYWRNNIVAFAPWVGGRVTAQGYWGEEVLTVKGTWFDHNLPLEDDPEFRTGVRIVHPAWELAGDWPGAGKSHEVVAGHHVARRLGLGPGDVVRVHADSGAGEFELRVTGVLGAGTAVDNVLVGHLATVQAMSGQDGLLNRVEVSALAVPEDDLSARAHNDPDSLDAIQWDRWYCTAYVSTIAHQLEEAVTNSVVRLDWQIVANEGAVVTKIKSLLITVSIAAALASILGVSSFMSLTIMKRNTEIGLMKALGAPNVKVYGIFVGEAALVGLIGGVLGVAAGIPIAQVIAFSIFGAGVTLPPIVIPVILGGAIFTSVVGSLHPARLITKIQPAAVLHGRK